MKCIWCEEEGTHEVTRRNAETMEYETVRVCDKHHAELFGPTEPLPEPELKPESLPEPSEYDVREKCPVCGLKPIFSTQFEHFMCKHASSYGDKGILSGPHADVNGLLWDAMVREMRGAKCENKTCGTCAWRGKEFDKHKNKAFCRRVSGSAVIVCGDVLQDANGIISLDFPACPAYVERVEE